MSLMWVVIDDGFVRITITITSSFAYSATSPLFAYVSNPAPDSSLCRAAAP